MSASEVLFAHVTRRRDEEIDLAAAALLIGEVEHGEIDLGPWINELDHLAEGSRQRAGDDAPPEVRLAALTDLLFRELRFRGNESDYYDPKNSCLVDVIERRLGIPITLSVLVLCVGWRLGLDLGGLAFPGHFMVLARLPAGNVIVDPFFRGVTVDVDDLPARLERITGRKTDVRPDRLPVASRRQILTRMLNNLRAIYARRSDPAREQWVRERLALLGGEAGDTPERH